MEPMGTFLAKELCQSHCIFKFTKTLHKITKWCANCEGLTSERPPGRKFERKVTGDGGLYCGSSLSRMRCTCRVAVVAVPFPAGVREVICDGGSDHARRTIGR